MVPICIFKFTCVELRYRDGEEELPAGLHLFLYSPYFCPDSFFQSLLVILLMYYGRLKKSMIWADHPMKEIISFFYLIFFAGHLYPPCCRQAGRLSLQDWLPETAPLWLKGRQWERGSPHSNAAGVLTRPLHPRRPVGPGPTR